MQKEQAKLIVFLFSRLAWTGTAEKNSKECDIYDPWEFKILKKDPIIKERDLKKNFNKVTGNMYAAAPKDFYFLIVSSNFQFLALAGQKIIMPFFFLFCPRKIIDESIYCVLCFCSTIYW